MISKRVTIHEDEYNALRDAVDQLNVLVEAGAEGDGIDEMIAEANRFLDRCVSRRGEGAGRAKGKGATVNTCGECKFWDFKVSTDTSFGRCMNPQVQVSTYISLVKCDFGVDTIDRHRAILKEVKTYAAIYFEENTFGCIHFEGKTTASPEAMPAKDEGDVNG